MPLLRTALLFSQLQVGSLFLHARDKQLAAVKVNKDDVKIIAAEFELDATAADRRLREHSGSLFDALQSFL